VSNPILQFADIYGWDFILREDKGVLMKCRLTHPGFLYFKKLKEMDHGRWLHNKKSPNTHLFLK